MILKFADVIILNLGLSWDIFITLVLIFACALIPLKLALEDEFASEWDIILYMIDIAFIIDMILCFLTAYDDEDFQVHDDTKEIAYNYIVSWFFIDLLALIPFDLIISSAQGDQDTGRG